MGQCFPLPDDESLREAMQLHAENHVKIYNMYNFDRVPEPGSDMDNAEKLWNKQKVKTMRAWSHPASTAPVSGCF